MGEQNAREIPDETALQQFSRQLIQDMRAMEYMLAEGLFETGVRRIGAEQELFLIDRWGQPAPIIEAVLEATTDPRIVTELARFNLEFNLTPVTFGGDALSRLEGQMTEMLQYVRTLVQDVGGDIVLVGILPTIHISDLTLDNMTDRARYHALNDAIMRLRGGPAQVQIRGVDELFFKHNSIMIEACNTSFQTHFQVDPGAFARYYNFAQAVAGPVLAVAVNAPLLFGKRLWRETRIALFQQAVDTRGSNLYLREMSPRVHFGTGWVERSVTEIFREDIARFPVLLTVGRAEDPMPMLREGRVPPMRALQLHNGTVYRWNRACYGITEGKPHLRIENRILPAGPTPRDEVANAAFWFGLVSGLAETYEDITDVVDFEEAKHNFVAAARHGLASQLTWVDGARRPAAELIGETLLPLAARGLRAAGITASDADRYLDVIARRAETGRTGAEWQIASLAAMKKHGTRAECLAALVGAMAHRQSQGQPVHTWEPATLDEVPGTRRLRSSRVEHYMNTDLFTVHEDELVEFVATLMDWQRLRYILVEDRRHRLVGLVSSRRVLHTLALHGPSREGKDGVPVKDIMVCDPITISPETPCTEAIRRMREHRVGALPVVRDGQLVGIVTERDFLDMADQLLDESLEPEDAALPVEQDSVAAAGE